MLLDILTIDQLCFSKYPPQILDGILFNDKLDVTMRMVVQSADPVTELITCILVFLV